MDHSVFRAFRVPCDLHFKEHIYRLWKSYKRVVTATKSELFHPYPTPYTFPLNNALYLSINSCIILSSFLTLQSLYYFVPTPTPYTFSLHNPLYFAIVVALFSPHFGRYKRLKYFVPTHHPIHFPYTTPYTCSW